MKTNLPEMNFFDGFYIWFNKEKKEEYYATPLYLYKANTKVEYDNRLVSVYLEDKKKKTPIEEQGLKFPGNMYFPYHEKFGMFLVRFLNADFKNYESAYDTFFMLMVSKF